MVDAYYVDRDSTHRAGFPALRRHALIAGNTFASDEIIPGIEDMQVQFGIDPCRHGRQRAALREPERDPVGRTDRVGRIWLLVRAENPEVGFRDNRAYQYADRATATGTTANLNTAGSAGFAYAPADGFRRLLVSRTIQIRNALGT